MKFLFLVSIIYLNYLLKLNGYTGVVKNHSLNNILNKRIIRNKKINLIKINLQNDYNYENKKYFSSRPFINEKSLNKITLIGRVGCEPDIKILNGGDKVATFSLATNEFWRDRNTNELKSKTDWHRIVVYDQNLVELVDKYLRKGRRVYLQGSLHTRRWFGNDLNNQPKQITEVVLSYNKSDLIFLDDRRNFINRNAPQGQPIDNQNINNNDINHNINNINNSNDIIPNQSNSNGNLNKNDFSTSLDENTDDNFDMLNDNIDKNEGIYDKMNTQEFEE
ncbi:single-stranded DNA-binding protein, putative [Plasmodium gallinaceum]|uniref:Single-stranded DNA-binding protein, putative n=1 Tax=Plasmodium gallinaceum TaxID=5849 RepID=A0A1J1H3E4_PLAGA|nr:single-stranded DNA-binding protein, putative [Plasmodium gallinaceum]CRG97864.1 single-stranded DNA-binding protein, putative [Plasmodium gallinaceum]